MNILQELNQPMLKSELLESKVPHDPLSLFETWMTDAIDAKFYQPNAMALATQDNQGQPHVRIVLLKSFDPQGFIFYTHYLSQKGQDLAYNPHGEVLFYWDILERQVRIQGEILPISSQESEDYFHSRARDSQIGALTSPQSQVIPDREFLETAYQNLERIHQHQPLIPKPDHWGGYRLVPSQFEFWQGRKSRLHDRLRYQKRDQAWILERLAP